MMYTVSQKKTSHLNFRHNFAVCWDIFTIFEAPCSELIAGWYNLLHTHHRCEAFTWCDVTHDVIQALARSAHWHQISYHLTRCLNSPDLNLAGYSFWSIMQEPDIRGEYRWVKTLASSGMGGAGPQTLSLQLWDAVSVRVTHVWKLRGIFWPTFALNFTCSLWGYLLNSWPM